MLLKDDNVLWIKPVHTNPVFYRASNGKTVHLSKDIEQELKDGDQIGLLPTSFFFRISFSDDVNNNNIDSNDHILEKTTTQSPKAILLKDNSSDVVPKPYTQDTAALNKTSIKDQVCSFKRITMR